MILKHLSTASSEDNSSVRLSFEGHDGEKCNVDMSIQDFRGILNTLIEFMIQTEVAIELPLRNPETDLPAHDHALLVAKDVNLVRWGSDAVVIHIQTTIGAPLQIALKSELVSFLRHILQQNS